MRRLTLIILILVSLACESKAAPRRAAASLLDAPRRILVITAHPDDDVVFAPYLHDRCVRGGAACTILVLTAGEGGQCALPEGCAPSLGDVRMAEMARAAALLNLRLIQWRYPDVFDVTQWGNRDALIAALHDVILLERPDRILTFHPDHGTTGHPAHRAVGQLVLDTGAKNVWLLDTVARFEGNGFVFSPFAPGAHAFFARDHWEALVRDAETHRSQFNAEQLESLRHIPEEQRVIWLRPVS